MVPARQRFEAGDGAIVEPHDRLIKDGDLVALERAAQIGFDRQPVGLARAHGGLEHVDAIAAGALGVIHRKLGVLEHFLGALRLAVAERQPDRGGEEYFAILERDRRAQRRGAWFRQSAVMRAGSRSDSRMRPN